MVKIIFSVLTLSFSLSLAIGAQNTDEGGNHRTQVIVTDNTKVNKAPVKSSVPTPTPIVIGGRQRVVNDNPTTSDSLPKPQPTPVRVITQPANQPTNREIPASEVKRATPDPLPVSSVRTLSYGQIKSRLAEAKRQMQTRPLVTSAVNTQFTGIETVRVAFHDWRKGDIDYVVLAKEAFLSTKEPKVLTTENGLRITLRTIRGNGVNTPVVIIDEAGNQHLPLMVQYPRVTKGQYLETAYYMSTHPGLVTPEVISAGQIYVRNVIDIAREKLRERGVKIDPKVADIAERLAAVEHVDHWRFRNENHPDIYNDIYTLFALNEGQTYRFAVSSAGAGGMVQMIPSTYRMVRSHFSQVPLMPDFVEGMRDHVNASKAMLLYMQWTWEDLKSRSAIANALETGLATQEQLMSAGYNSNPARLAGYINRGGANWTTLIPRETQIYLQIYSSVERHVPMTPRKN